MIRVYAGEGPISEEVRKWLAPAGFQFYPLTPWSEAIRRQKGTDPSDTLVEIVSEGGDVCFKVGSPEQQDGLLKLLKARGVKMK